MTTYAIGDIQGCYTSLQKLLNLIQFDEKKDTVWFTGDLINRGPQSLETLRFIKSLKNHQRVVLGNHDLHFLAVAHHAAALHQDDTFQAILNAPDREELIHWLCHQPLLHDEENFLMIHAGLAPNWNLSSAKKYANEVETILRSSERTEFFKKMYGNFPDQWHDDLKDWDRLRCITNYLTRARFCYPDGRLCLSLTENISSHTKDFYPWFQLPQREMISKNIIFGHWAALGGITNMENIFALDTGCVWGYCLTAMRLEDKKKFSVNCTETGS